MYIRFTEIPMHRIKNREMGRYIHQVIMRQFLMDVFPQFRQDILLSGD